MPDRDWPPLQRTLARVARAVMYTGAAVAGAMIVADAPGLLVRELGATWTVVLGVLAAVAGTAAVLAVATHRWMVEWVATWFVAAATGGYAALDWLLVANGHHGQVAQAAIVTTVTAACIARGVDLWIFSMQVGRVKRWRSRWEQGAA